MSSVPGARASELIFTHKVEDKNFTAAVKGVCGRVSHSITRPFPDFSHDAQANAQWAANELGSIQLGHRRMVKVFTQMLNSSGKSIPQCSRSVAEAKAFYRLPDGRGAHRHPALQSLPAGA